MAMTMTAEVQLPPSRDAVWAKLNDAAVLKSCIPGCELLHKNSDNEFRAVATIKIGPVKARWKEKVRFSDLDPPNSYRISGEDEGGTAATGACPNVFPHTSFGRMVIPVVFAMPMLKFPSTASISRSTRSAKDRFWEMQEPFPQI